VTRSLHVAGSRPRVHVCTCRPDGLDSRDALICARLASGIPLRAVAAELGVTASTLSTLIARARGKVGARTREQLVAVAFREQMIGFDRDGRVVVAETKAAVA
jgi:DNA-binding CsgD family transcriptional regulator